MENSLVKDTLSDDGEAFIQVIKDARNKTLDQMKQDPKVEISASISGATVPESPIPTSADESLPEQLNIRPDAAHQLSPSSCLEEVRPKITDDVMPQKPVGLVPPSWLKPELPLSPKEFKSSMSNLAQYSSLPIEKLIKHKESEKSQIPRRVLDDPSIRADTDNKGDKIQCSRAGYLMIKKLWDMSRNDLSLPDFMLERPRRKEVFTYEPFLMRETEKTEEASSKETCAAKTEPKDGLGSGDCEPEHLVSSLFGDDPELEGPAVTTPDKRSAGNIYIKKSSGKSETVFEPETDLETEEPLLQDPSLYPASEDGPGEDHITITSDDDTETIKRRRLTNPPISPCESRRSNASEKSTPGFFSARDVYQQVGSRSIRSSHQQGPWTANPQQFRSRS